jgi:hypothetical protein
VPQPSVKKKKSELMLCASSAAMQVAKFVTKDVHDVARLVIVTKIMKETLASKCQSTMGCCLTIKS